MSWWPGVDPVPLGWFVCGPYPGTFVAEICVHTARTDCFPPPECPKCPKNEGGSPIIFATGDTYIEENDVSLPGLGGGLTLSRLWNSVWPAKELASSIGMFGPNWRSTYEERVFLGGDNWVKYSRHDGSYWSFGLPATPGIGNTFFGASPFLSGNYLALVPGPSTWTLTFQNGEQRQFNLGTGMLTAIIDRNGNSTQLTYDSSSRLTTVTDPASRHLYFNYGTGAQSLLVTSVTSDFGVTLSYAYDTQGRLTQVTRPDQSTINFTYNSASQITQVTDSNGKVLESHTYDSQGRGLTSSQANGVNALTVSYQ
jgi:YD repeat-containing protein